MSNNNDGRIGSAVLVFSTTGGDLLAGLAAACGRIEKARVARPKTRIVPQRRSRRDGGRFACRPK